MKTLLHHARLGFSVRSNTSWHTSAAVLLLTAVVTASSADTPKSATQILTSGNTAFALDLYQQEKGRGGNLFFSPYSISTALAMTYAGARERTEKEMARVLHFSMPQAELHEAFAALTARFDQIQSLKQISLNVANSLWMQRDYAFHDAFLEINQKYYCAETRLVDFVGNGEAAGKEINTWIERNTQDKIRDVIQPGQISRDTVLVLCNAVYFKGNWVTRFDRKATVDTPFFLKPGQSVTVPMMFQMLRWPNHRSEEVTLVALPYAGNDLSMVILLPNEVNGLGALEQKLTVTRLSEWLAELDQYGGSEAQLYLPRFRISCRLDLTRSLSALGMPSAFDNRADFSGMSKAKDLSVSEVAHQAFVDVNEEGTEAAAASESWMTRGGPPGLIVVNHPFLFLIRERQTGSILFLGRVADPTK